MTLSRLQNYSFSFKAITLQGKIQEGQSIDLRVIFYSVKRSLCRHHHHHLTWGPLRMKHMETKGLLWLLLSPPRHSLLAKEEHLHQGSWARDRECCQIQHNHKPAPILSMPVQGGAKPHLPLMGLHQQSKGISVLCVPATHQLTFDWMSHRKERTAP